MAGELYFLIEGGKTLAMVKSHIADVVATDKRNAEICRELGVKRAHTSIATGVVAGFVFDGKRHPDFKAPNRNGVSYPKKGSEWAKKLAAEKGFDGWGHSITEELGIPTTISYKSENGWGSGVIGGFHAAGFLFLSVDGPYALWINDIEAAVARHEAKGEDVEEPAKSFKPEFDGARRILKEEWDVLVARHQLERARVKAEKLTEEAA